MTTFKRLNAEDIVLGNPVEVTQGIWPGNTGSLTTIYTGSQATGSTSGQFYWNAYNINPTSSAAEICFAVSYGHRTGGGHPTLLQNDASSLATKAVYSQYRNLLLDPNDTQFTFAKGSTTYDSDHIYVINFARSLMKQNVDPGNWRLTLTGASGSFTFIDDSGQSLGSAFGRSGQVFNVVSGTLSGSNGATIATSGSATKGGYGLFYPSLGVIVLNPDAIVETVGFRSGSYASSGSATWVPVTGSVTTPQYNHGALFNAIKAGGDFQARSAENISSTHYFVSARPGEFNYTNNPTFFDETTGALIFNSFINDPRTYITGIGFYNDENELLAVAKPSAPIPKDFAKSVNISVRIDW